MPKYEVTFQDGEEVEITSSSSKKAIRDAQTQREIEGREIWVKKVRKTS